ncbi:MAG: PepSY domain-containing protein [Pseudooceanicola sp.]|nr:PepSY domain-containing protein [Pseudooceanicola sp.]
MHRSLILAALLFATPALANQIEVGAAMGKTEDDVKTALVALGYDVRKIEVEDGKIEAYVVKDNGKGEIYVDPTTGLVSKVHMK